MKKKYLLLSIGMLFVSIGFAQNNNDKADDMERISLTPIVDDPNAPAAAKDMLTNKMRQLCTLNGLAGDGNNPLFSMKATIDEVSKELTATAPPMHALTLTINMFIVDNETGNVYSQTSIDVKGVGQNETKAYNNAIRSIDPKKGQYKAFVDQGKNKILDFYNSQCDFVIARANALKAQGRNQEASAVLYSVPKVCKECYDQCMQIAAGVPATSEPIAVSQIAEDTNVQEVESQILEIENGIFLIFKECKLYGDKTRLTFNVENRNQKDYEFKVYCGDIRIIDNEGNNLKNEKSKLAGREFTWSESATVISGTPVVFECEFAAADVVKMFEMKKDNKTYRMRLNVNVK